MADGKIEIETGINTSGAEKGLKSLSQKLSSLGNSNTLKGLSNIGATITGVGVAFGAAKSAVQAVGAAISDLTATYRVQANAEIQLETAAKNNPYLLQENVTNLKNYAGELQKLSTYGDEELLPFMAQLASAGRTQQEIMDIMSASVNLAASGTMSLDSAVQGLNASYSGNLGMLGKSLPALKDLTAEQLKNGEAVKVVAKNYEGMAEATSKATGSAEQLKGAWGDFKEHLGSGFQAVITPIQQGITSILSGVNSTIGGFKQLMKDAKNYKRIMAGDTEGMDSSVTAFAKQTATMKNTSALSRYDEARADLEELIAGYTSEDFQKTGLGVIDRSSFFTKLSSAAQDLADGKKTRDFGNRALDVYVNALAELKKAEKELDTATRTHNKMVKQEADAEAQRLQEEWDAEVSAAIATAQNTVDKVNARRQTDKEIGKDWTDEEYAQKMADAYYEAYNTMLDQSSDWSKMQNESQVQAFLNEAKKWNAQVKPVATPSAGGSSAQKAEKSTEELAKELLDSIEQVLKNADFEEYFDGDDLTTLTNLGNPETIKQIEEVWGDQLETAISGLVKIAEEKGLTAQDVIDADGPLHEVYEKILSLQTSLGDLQKDKDKQAQYDDLMGQLGNVIGEQTLPLAKELKKRKDDLKKFADEVLEIYKDNEEKCDAIKQQMAEAEKALDHDITEAKREEWEERLSFVQNYVDRSAQLINYLSDLTIKAADAEKASKMADLEEQYEQGIIAETEYAEKQRQIEKETAEQKYKAELWQWGSNIAQMAVSGAQAVLSALSTQPIYAGIAMAGLVGAMTAAQMGVAIANKPKAPSFEHGGIVPGSSWSGDNVQARVNSGEMILTRAQQADLWKRLNSGQAGWGSVAVNNYMGGQANVRTRQDGNGLTIDVLDAHINRQMALGGYDSGFAGHDMNSKGVRYL